MRLTMHTCEIPLLATPCLALLTAQTRARQPPRVTPLRAYLGVFVRSRCLCLGSVEQLKSALAPPARRDITYSLGVVCLSIVEGRAALCARIQRLARLHIVRPRTHVREELVEKVRALLVQAGIIGVCEQGTRASVPRGFVASSARGAGRTLLGRVLPDRRARGLEARGRGLRRGHNRERRARVLLLRVDHLRARAVSAQAPRGRRTTAAKARARTRKSLAKSICGAGTEARGQRRGCVSVCLAVAYPAARQEEVFCPHIARPFTPSSRPDTLFLFSVRAAERWRIWAPSRDAFWPQRHRRAFVF